MHKYLAVDALQIKKLKQYYIGVSNTCSVLLNTQESLINDSLIYILLLLN